MKTAVTIGHWLVRLTGLIQIILGILFWTGNARFLVQLHMLVGLVLVLALWMLALLAARVGVPLSLVTIALAWGLITLILGIIQARLWPGSMHWIIQVLHLLVGLGAIGLGEQIATRIKRTQQRLPQNA